MGVPTIPMEIYRMPKKRKIQPRKDLEASIRYNIKLAKDELTALKPTSVGVSTNTYGMSLKL